MYNNGQRQAKMYGGGMAVRKPMMYGGTAMKKKKMQMGGMMNEKNIKPNQSGMMQATMPNNMMNTMGMKYGGKPDYLDFDKDGDKKEPMKKALRQKKSG